MIFKRSILFFLLLAYSLIKGQNWNWAKSGNGTNVDEGNSVTVDLSGNVIITGYFSSPTITFGTYTLTNSGSGKDIYVIKYDANGNIMWAKSVGGSGSDEGRFVNSDLTGNILLTGKFSSPNITFGTTTLTSLGSDDIFLAKFDTNGNTIWARSAGGTNTEVGESVDTDYNGNIFLTGHFTSAPIAFGTTTLSNSNFNNSLFIAKYDSNGIFQWVKEGGGPSSNYALSVSSDNSGNAIITGLFTGTFMTLDTYTITNPGAAGAILIAKFDTNGNLIWSRNTNSPSYDQGFAVDTDINGNIYVTGHFQSASITFGAFTLTNANPGNDSFFLVKYDPNGNALWAKTSGVGVNEGLAICTFSSGVIVTGNYWGVPIVFGSFTLSLPSTLSDPFFIVQYDFNGNVICADELSSGGADLTGVCADKYGNSYICGDYNNNPFVIGTTSLNLMGTEDVFTAKFNCLTTEVSSFAKENEIVKILPNPNNGYFKIQLEKEIMNGKLVLFNILGQNIHQENIFSGENYITINNLNQGLYKYIILTEKQVIIKGKIVIE